MKRDTTISEPSENTAHFIDLARSEACRRSCKGAESEGGVEELGIKAAETLLLKDQSGQLFTSVVSTSNGRTWGRNARIC